MGLIEVDMGMDKPAAQEMPYCSAANVLLQLRPERMQIAGLQQHIAWPQNSGGTVDL